MPKAENLIPTRRSLLSRLRNWDDQESWSDFFNTYWQLIHSVALKAGLTDVEAQEVVQETIIVVSRKMPDFHYDPKIGTFKSWLLNTTRWRIADQFRKRARYGDFPRDRASARTRTATVEQIPDPASLVPEEAWDREWQERLLHLAIENIKKHVRPRQFQVFDLYVIKRWPVERIKQTLGVSAAQIYLAKHRVAALLSKETRRLQKQWEPKG